MIVLEELALAALNETSMRIASAGKRFRRDILGQLERNPDLKLTKNQALYLWYLVDMYRRQIPDPELKRHGAFRKLTGELPEIYREGDLRPPVAHTSKRIDNPAGIMGACEHRVFHPPCTRGRKLRCSREAGHEGYHLVCCPTHPGCKLEW